MAITRTQIAKQLLAQGGRTGFQGGGADMGAEDRAQERADRGYGDTSGPDRSRTTIEQDANQRNVVREGRIREAEKLINRPTVRERINKGLTNLRNRNIKKFIDRSIRKDLFRSGFVPNAFMGINLPTTLGIASETGYSLFGPEVDSFDEDSLREIASTLTTTGGSLTKSQSKALESLMTKLNLGATLYNPLKDVKLEEINIEYQSRDKLRKNALTKNSTDNLNTLKVKTRLVMTGGRFGDFSRMALGDAKYEKQLKSVLKTYGMTDADIKKMKKISLEDDMVDEAILTRILNHMECR